jgi:hypothetical protein
MILVKQRARGGAKGLGRSLGVMAELLRGFARAEVQRGGESTEA